MISNILFGRRIAVVAGAVLAAAALAACSSSSSGSSATQTSGASSPPPSSGAPAANTLSVTAMDAGDKMSYDISGSPHPGLVTITFANNGDEAHEMTYQQLKPGKTLAQLKKALAGSNPEQAAGALVVDPHGDTTGPSIVGPGRSVKVATKISAGHYVVGCFLPGKDGTPHAVMGMSGEFTVAGSDSPAAPQQTDGTVALTDTGITLPAVFAKGGTFEVKNTGTKPHDFSVAKLAGQPLGAYFQCVGASFGKGPIDRCPGTLQGGVTTISPGQSADLTLTLAHGNYGYVSTGGDGADFKAGLNGTFSVK